MPRIAPKKVTRRDDRDLQRQAEKFKLATYGKLDVFKSTNKPIMLGNKGERRALRAALSAEGISLERWICENSDECFYYVPVDRYLTTQYTSPSDLNDLVDKDPDQSLQMYIRTSENCKEKISDLLNSFDRTVPAAPARPRRNRVKMSRRQAKAHHDGTLVSLMVPDSCKVDDLSVVNTLESSVTASEASTETPFIPTGTVHIRSSVGDVLSADSAGRLTWCGISSETDGMQWTLSINPNGKYTLRSTYGLYLSHCLLWGFVADRVSASTWEEFDLCLMGKSKSTSLDGVECSLKSWRSVYMGQGHHNNVSRVNNVDNGSTIHIVSV